MKYSIKVRLTILNRKQLDLIPIIEEKEGLTVAPAELSRAITGKGNYPKMQRIRKAAEEIVEQWEREAEENEESEN